MHPDAAKLVELLGLVPHPEGGVFRETFRSAIALAAPPGGRLRNASTAIYFLLAAGPGSAMHRVTSADEAWHHYDGDPVDLLLVSEEGTRTVVRLGHDFAAGERPQHVVPAGTWQAAQVVGDRYALCGCTVAPGFDFEDFQLAPTAPVR